MILIINKNIMYILRCILIVIIVHTSIYVDTYAADNLDSVTDHYTIEDTVRLYTPEWIEDSDYPVVPKISALSYMLVYRTNAQIIVEHNSNIIMPLASLTKLMTALVVLEAVHEKSFTWDKQYMVKEEDIVSLPYDASIMGLKAGDMPTGLQLFQGLLVHSGNDAALVLASAVSGSVNAFVTSMNDKARELLLNDTVYADPTGLSKYNISSARNMARLALYILEYPYFNITNVTCLKSITWNNTVLKNTNSLVSKYEQEVNGLKTGYTDAAGFHLIATGTRDTKQLLALVMKVDANTIREGVLKREKDAWTLLQYGFDYFKVQRFMGSVRNVKVWGGEQDTLQATATTNSMYVPTHWVSDIQIQYQLQSTKSKKGLWAPINHNEIIGTAIFSLKQSKRIIATTSLKSADRIHKGNIFKQFLDVFRSYHLFSKKRVAETI